MMNAQNAKVQNLLSSVKDALLGFNSDELTVTEKNGKVYVAIEKDAEAEHTIELRMNDESESKKFTLMAIGYN